MPNLTDNRKPFDWQPKYPKEAYIQICCEAFYVGTLLLVIPILLFVVWTGLPNSWFHLTEARYRTLSLYLYAWLGGSLGVNTI